MRGAEAKMKLISLTIPDDTALWPKWIEDQLLSDDLADTVVELEVLARAQEPGPESLDEVLGDLLPEILRNGLDGLPADAVRTLLSHPVLLLDLQERVLIEGGDYWDRVPITSEHRQQIDEQWRLIQSQLNNDSGTPVDASAPTIRDRRSVSVKIWSLAAMAAAVLVALGIWISRPAAPTWGFDRSGLLAKDISAPEYLTSLADAADEWFKKRPDSKTALAKRLREFRHGCDTLIAAPHPQLSNEDRTWLRDRCRAWADKVDGHLADLEDGNLPVLTVRSEADRTIEKLKAALRDRAQKAA